jgi:hypothetical protein
MQVGWPYSRWGCDGSYSRLYSSSTNVCLIWCTPRLFWMCSKHIMLSNKCVEGFGPYIDDICFMQVLVKLGGLGITGQLLVQDIYIFLCIGLHRWSSHGVQ